MRQTANGYEEIKSYTHFPGVRIDVLIGTGQPSDSGFQFTFPQQFFQYQIIDITEAKQAITDVLIREAHPDYTDLINETGGAITEESLWNAIDIIRSRA